VTRLDRGPGGAFYNRRDIQRSGMGRARDMRRLIVVFIAVSLFSSLSLVACHCNPYVQKQATSVGQAGPDPYQAVPPAEFSPAPAVSVGPG
jgi:hypothetical protein